jgi:hypothetical protein
MGKRTRWFGGLAVAVAVLVGAQVGITPAFAALDQQWIVQPYTIPGSAPDSVAIVNGSTTDAGVINVQVLSTYAGADVERFQILDPNVTTSDVDAQLTLATSGVPATAKPAMQWFKDKTRWYSGANVTEHARFKVVQNAGTYNVAQITPGRVAATAKQFTVRGTSTATLPSTSQTLRMEPNNTFSVSTGGAIPTIHQVPLRVENNSTELHFVQFLPVSSSTTVAQATNWCAGTGPSPVTGAAPFGVGTMSGGVTTVVETFTAPTGRYILADFLPNSQTGTSNLVSMCKLVKVAS